MNASEIKLTPRRELGKTGFAATALGIGDLADRSVPLEDCVAVVHRAMDHGLNLIDTAPGYEGGYSEQIVAAALKGRRDGMFVIDKVDHWDQPAIPQVDASLAALGIDCVDLFVFHGLSAMHGWEGVTAPGAGMDQLDQCVTDGKCRFRGISSHDPDTLVAAITSGRCDVVMFPVGPYVHPRYVDEILPLAKANHVGTVCFKTFGAGKLLGDTEGYGRPLSDRPRGKLSSGGSDEAAATLPRLTVEQCLHYTLTCDPDVALLGMSFPNELAAAIQAWQSYQPMSAEQLAETRNLADQAIVGKGRCWWNPQN